MRTFFIIFCIAVAPMLAQAKEHRAPVFDAMLAQVESVAKTAQQDGVLTQTQARTVFDEVQALRASVTAPMEQDRAHLVRIQQVFAGHVQVAQLNHETIHVSRLINELDSTYTHAIADYADAQRSVRACFMTLSFLLLCLVGCFAHYRTKYSTTPTTLA